MTIRIGNIILICDEEEQQCDECGKMAELRPYGKNGACICWECGRKNPEETDKNMNHILWDE